MSIFLRKTLFPFILAFVFSCSVVSAQNDRLTVESDTINYDSETGRSVFEGNVIMGRGGLKLNADRVERHTDSDQGDHLIATGSPLKFTFLAQDSDRRIVGQADQVIYWLKTEEIRFSGNVIIEGNRASFRAKEAIYNTRSGELRVLSGTQGQTEYRLRSTIEIDGN